MPKAVLFYETNLILDREFDNLAHEELLETKISLNDSVE